MKRTTPQADGPITKALLDAVTMRRQMLDNGHPAKDVDYHVGQGLKALLGNKRSEPWRFLCERCRDTGWSAVKPSTDEEVKLMGMYGCTDDNAGYSVKCEPCRYMDREREKRRKIAGDSGYGGEEDFASAGQMKPKRGFSKFGMGR